MLRPDDIRSTSFKKGLFGYKAAEVDSFKDTVFRAYSDLSKDYEETKDKFDKLTKAMEDTRLKLFELENKLQQAENVSSDAGESVEAKKRADQIIKNAEATAADIIAKAKAQSEKLENTAKPKAEPEKAKESASSKFFKKADEDVHTAATSNEDDDEIFVGEIEDARKPDRMMIGDGEEEDEGFEFL